jgi:hypothetical protein
VVNRTRPDDSELIESIEDAPSQGGSSGGNLQRKVGARAEVMHAIGDGDGPTRVRARDKTDGADLPRFNNK